MDLAQLQNVDFSPETESNNIDTEALLNGHTLMSLL